MHLVSIRWFDRGRGEATFRPLPVNAAQLRMVPRNTVDGPRWRAGGSGVKEAPSSPPDSPPQRKALPLNLHVQSQPSTADFFQAGVGQADPAIDYGLKSFKINPYFVLNLIQLGDLYAQKKDFAQARIYYQKAYAVNPHNPALKTLIQNAH